MEELVKIVSALLSTLATPLDLSSLYIRHLN